MNLNDLVTCSTITLEKIRVMCADVIGPTMRDSPRFDIDRDCAADRFIGMLSAWVMAESIKEATETVTFEYPASWWQHFKAQCFPSWLARRFPPRMRVEHKAVHFSAKEVYPMFTKLLPPDETRLHRTIIQSRVDGRRRFDECDDGA